MFPLPPVQQDELCHLAMLSDKEARSDLIAGYVNGENDYTSTFTGSLRRNINAHSASGLSAVSYVLPNTIEQQLGCDAAILIKSKNQIKICVFEAKLPRFSKGARNWDSYQSTQNTSHFVSQLNRQAVKAGRFAIFEMFYCESPFGQQPSYMFDEESSCVWHDEAMQFNKSRSKPDAVWRNTDLDMLLSSSGLQIDHILASVCQCKKGQTIETFGSIGEFATEFSISGPILLIDASPLEN